MQLKLKRITFFIQIIVINVKPIEWSLSVYKKIEPQGLNFFQCKNEPREIFETQKLLTRAN